MARDAILTAPTSGVGGQERNYDSGALSDQATPKASSSWRHGRS